MRQDEYNRPPDFANPRRWHCQPVPDLGFSRVTVKNPTDAILAFVNEHPVRVPPGACAADAVRAFDPALADRVASNQAYLTDGRGIRVEPGAVLTSGDIIRAVVSARRGEPHADA